MFGEQKTSGALIGLMRESNWTMRGIASVVILTFGGLVTAPAVAAVKQEIKEIQWHKPAEAPGAKLSARLQAVRDHLAMAGKQNLKDGSFVDERKELKADAEALADLDKDTLDSFASVSKMIQDKHLPEVIQQRELAAEKHYKIEMAALRQGLDAVAQEKDDSKAQAKTREVLDRLSKFQMERSAQKFDPNNMPNRSLKPDLTRVPHTTKKSFAEAGFNSNPRLMVATTASNFDYSQLPGASDPAYLAATTEVTLSPTIQAQAAALHNNPVEIYNWVRNNVQWQPTWGAVQDADLTLSAQRGNAFDISSLLIALLRASGIPARYVHGTINVPEAKFRNWVGGFQDINAAVNYASAGGIPVKSLISGGKIVTVQMEHIWVEAAIDYIPSRGAVNKSADNWVPMDASYKQQNISTGIDVTQISGLDTNALSNQFLSTLNLDPSGNWFSGANPGILDAAQQSGYSSLQNYVSANMPNSSLFDIRGGRQIIAVDSKILSAGLNTQVVAIGARYGTLPVQLEQSITFGLGADGLGASNHLVTLPWAQLNNQKVTISFVPATEADEEVLQSLMPGTPITDLSQLPTVLPAYLVTSVPEVKVNDTVVLTGDPIGLGNAVPFTFTSNLVNHGSIPNEYDVLAGSYLGLAVIAGSVSQQKIEQVQGAIAATQATFDSQDVSLISKLSRDQILGDMFATGLLGYYSNYLAVASAVGIPQGGRHELAAGVGSFGFEPHVTYLFGIPKSISGGGLFMNLPIVNVFGLDHSDPAASKYYTEQVGILSSALEEVMPERMFDTPGQPVSGISAVRALALANSAGQKIYHITESNAASVLPLIHASSQALGDISSAVASGKEVITHTDPVAVPGWSGSGYVILDPATGDGAYKISGGQNGGFLLIALLMIGIMALLAAWPLFAGAGATFFALSDVSMLRLIYIAVQEFILFFDALKVASTDEEIALSKCSDQEKRNMAHSIAFYEMLQAITVAMGFGMVKNAGNNVAKEFVGEAISFIGNVGGYKVFDPIIDEAVTGEIESCH